MDLQVTITEKTTVITYSDTTLTIAENLKDLPKEALYLFTNQKKPTALHLEAKKSSSPFDQVLALQQPWEFSKTDFATFLFQKLTENKLTLEKDFPDKKIPTNYWSSLEKNYQTLATVLKTFGFHLEKPKVKPAKAQHRWNKAVSQIEFFVDYNDATGTVLWQKRNEMLLKAGAHLKEEPVLNKDGSIGFSARLTEKLRADHAAVIENFITTEDIILKSVNEVGIFLYYAGTNGWLVLKDASGKTIDEYTVVK